MSAYCAGAVDIAYIGEHWAMVVGVGIRSNRDTLGHRQGEISGRKIAYGRNGRASGRVGRWAKRYDGRGTRGCIVKSGRASLPSLEVIHVI